MWADRMYEPKAKDDDALLVEIRAAELLSLSSRTLQAWRIKGEGPAFVRAGRAIRYRRRDLLAWMDAQTVHGPSEQRPIK